MKHGTISLIEEGMPVIVTATQSKLFDKTISNVREVKSRGAVVVIICPDYVNIDSDCADYKIGLPDAEDLFLPLISVVAMQLIAYYTAVQRGCDVDKPRNLAKSVTVE